MLEELQNLIDLKNNPVSSTIDDDISEWRYKEIDINGAIVSSVKVTMNQNDVARFNLPSSPSNIEMWNTYVQDTYVTNNNNNTVTAKTMGDYEFSSRTSKSINEYGLDLSVLYSVNMSVYGFKISVNSGTPIDFKEPVSLNLNANDKVVFSADNYNLSSVRINEGGNITQTGEKTFVVTNAGSYTFKFSDDQKALEDPTQRRLDLTIEVQNK